MSELQFVKAKVVEMDKELHDLREAFADTHLSEEERNIFAETLKEEQQGKTIPIHEVKKRLGL